ncbi:hypothetical protein LBMAG53_10990 [Planctomycetota bacterium]|nr:hypothetical protein LBMAG53_10990 [Planctomycetota bacterium]
MRYETIVIGAAGGLALLWACADLLIGLVAAITFGHTGVGGALSREQAGQVVGDVIQAVAVLGTGLLAGILACLILWAALRWWRGAGMGWVWAAGGLALILTGVHLAAWGAISEARSMAARLRAGGEYDLETARARFAAAHPLSTRLVMAEATLALVIAGGAAVLVFGAVPAVGAVPKSHAVRRTPAPSVDGTAASPPEGTT